MKPIIVTISASDYLNAREICKTIENQTYKTYSDLREHLNKVLKFSNGADEENQPQFFTLNEFSFEINEDYFNGDSSYISYVNIENTNKQLWDYSISSNSFWSTFDSGTVEADTYDEALKLAEKELENNFATINRVLKRNVETIGHTVEYSISSIELEKQK